MNIIIKGTNLELSEAIKAYVHEKVGMLGRLASKIMEARVESVLAKSFLKQNPNAALALANVLDVNFKENLFQHS